MKSCCARWNPSKLGWNLQPSASDEIKSVLSLPAKRDFITKWFHPTLVGFIPSVRTDLVEKSHPLTRMAFFLPGAEGLEPTTPSFGDWCSTNWTIPLCTNHIISHKSSNCNTFFKKNPSLHDFVYNNYLNKCVVIIYNGYICAVSMDSATFEQRKKWKTKKENSESFRFL